MSIASSNLISSASKIFFTWLVHPIYSVESRSSVEQLRADFGEFPPKPLCCEGVAGEFEVVRVRGVGEVVAELVMSNMILRGVDSETQVLSIDIVDHFGAEQMFALRRVLGDIDRQAKFIKPAVIALMLAVLSVRMIGRRFQSAHRNSKVLGYFVPIRLHESTIFVRVVRHKKTGRCEAPTTCSSTRIQKVIRGTRGRPRCSCRSRV